jgi:hypothetical protein
MNKYLLGGIFITSIGIVTFLAYQYVNPFGFQSSKGQLSCNDFLPYSKGSHDMFLAQCNSHIGKQCNSNAECGAFPCLNGTCFIKACKRDFDCKSSFCGKAITPVRGFCTTVDVE